MRRLLLSMAAVALLLAPVTAAATTRSEAGWTPHRAADFTVSLPTTWKVVPLTRAGTLNLASSLQSEGQTNLAAWYRSYGQDPYQWDKPLALFHAFQWPEPPTAVGTDVVVKGYPTGGASLHDLAKTLASELRKGAGITVTGPVHLSGTVEDCYLIEARAKLDKSYKAKASYTLSYLYLHGQTIYELFVRGEAGLQGSYRTVANQIAASFKFS